MKIAILMTCFNRKEYTLNCLEKLRSMFLHDSENQCKIFVCDDNSNDGTQEMIMSLYPEVKLICSSGNLFWCKGMYEVMQNAFAEKYDLYLMVNDDVEFADSMLNTMLESYKKTDSICGIVGTTKSKKDNVATYGGRKSEFDLQIILPDIELRECGVANWNCFMIPHEVIEQVGMIDRKYAHSYGDYDYSLTMNRKKIPIYVAMDYVGYCERNGIEGTYRDPSLPRIERLKKLFGKKGRPFYSNVRYYVKNFGGIYLFVAFFKYLEYIKAIILKQRL